MSYHDVKVIVDSKEYNMSTDYGIELSCCKTAGWRLWKTAWNIADWKIIGGEFDGNDFKIIINNVVILDIKIDKEKS
jgi:hypothetical protein